MILQVYAPQPTPRVRYCVAFWAEELLKVPVRIHTDPADYRSATGWHLNYSYRRELPHECWIVPQGLLFETGWRAQAIRVFQCRGRSAFFGEPGGEGDLPFDLLAMSFYLLSRYEEYLDFTPDAHGRFPARASLAHRHGFLSQALLDAWALELRRLLGTQPGRAALAPPPYQFLPTYDIDLAWAYRHKGGWRFWGGLWRDLFYGRWKAVGERLKVGLGWSKDPFDTFDYMGQWQEKLRFDPVYFFLVGEAGPYDKNHAPDNPPFQQLIRQLHRSYRIGLHPSYRSYDQPARVAQEQHRLESIIGEPIVRSRQHYLRLRFPHTYQTLLDVGIREDHTMGYADALGFRAGTSRACWWYDLATEQQTPLRVVPFAVMDVTLRQYLALEPTAALALVADLIAELRTVGGTFAMLWHNNSLSEREGWEGWRRVYEGMVTLGRE